MRRTRDWISLELSGLWALEFLHVLRGWRLATYTVYRVILKAVLTVALCTYSIDPSLLEPSPDPSTATRKGKKNLN